MHTKDILVNLQPLDHEIDFLEKCLERKCDVKNFVVAVSRKILNLKTLEKEIINEFALFYFLGHKTFYLVNKWTCGIKYPNFFERIKFHLSEEKYLDCDTYFYIDNNQWKEFEK